MLVERLKITRLCFDENGWDWDCCDVSFGPEWPYFFVASTLSPTQFPHSCISATQIPPARSELQLTGCQGYPETELRFENLEEKKDRHKNIAKKGSKKTKKRILMNRTMNFVWVCWLCTLDLLWSWWAMRGLDWKSQELNTNSGAKACSSLLVYMECGYSRW